MNNSSYFKYLEKVFKENQAHLERSARRYGIGLQNTEDCIQDLFLKILEKQIDLSKLDNPKSWLNKVFSRQCISLLRKKDLTTSFDFNTLIDTSDDAFDLEQTLDLLKRTLEDYKKNLSHPLRNSIISKSLRFLKSLKSSRFR